MLRRPRAATNFTIATTAPIMMTTAPHASIRRTIRSTMSRSVDSGSTSKASRVELIGGPRQTARLRSPCMSSGSASIGAGPFRDLRIRRSNQVANHDSEKFSAIISSAITISAGM